jgi:hypothetical protein
VDFATRRNGRRDREKDLLIQNCPQQMYPSSSNEISDFQMMIIDMTCSATLTLIRIILTIIGYSCGTWYFSEMSAL